MFLNKLCIFKYQTGHLSITFFNISHGTCARHEKEDSIFANSALITFSLIIAKPKHKQALLPEVTLDASKQNRLLVIAPHCDDEVIGAFGLMRRTLEGKGIVKLVIVTNGDAFTVAAKKSLSLSGRYLTSIFVWVILDKWNH